MAWTQVHGPKYVWLSQRASHQVLLFMGSTASMAVIQRCQAFQKLSLVSRQASSRTLLNVSHPPLWQTAFEPTSNLIPTIKLPAFKVYILQTTSWTFGHQRGIRSHFKMTLLRNSSLQKERVLGALIKIAPTIQIY